MSSSDIDVNSCTDVLHFCLTKHNTCSEEILAKEVAGVAKLLTVGLEFYRPLKAATGLDEKFFKAKQLTDDVSKLLRRLCEDLKLEAAVGHTVFLQYINHDASFSDKTLTSLLRSSHATAEFVKRFRAFYCLERLSLLSLLTLALADGEERPLADLLFAATGKSERAQVVEMVIAQYEKHCGGATSQKPPNTASAVREEEDLTDNSHTQQLQEQLQLLKALLVAAISRILTPSHCERLQRLFRAHTLAKRSSELVRGGKDSELVEQLITYQFLICVHACDCQAFFALSAADKIAIHPMASPERMEALDKVVVGLDHRPYMDAFLLLTSLCHMAFGQGEKAAYGRRAVREFHVFDRLLQRLQQLDTALQAEADGGGNMENSLLLDAVYTFLYDFLALLLNCVHVDSLCEEREPFLVLLCHVLPRVVPMRGPNSRSLAPLVPLLEDLSAEFPHSLALVNVCAALATDNKEIAQLVTQLIERQRVFTETTDAACTDVRCVRPCPSRTEEFVTVEARMPYGSQGSLIIPKGTRGVLRGSLISWKFTYNFWDVVYSEVRARVPRVWNRLRQIFEFARKWMAAERFFVEAMPLTSSAILLARAIDRSAFTTKLDMEMAASRLAMALRLVALQLSDDDATGVVEQLVHSGLVPIVRKVEDTSWQNASIAVESSVFEDIHSTYERRFGYYPVTEAYLELCLALIPAADSELRHPNVWADRGPLLIAAVYFMADGLLARLQEERSAFLSNSGTASHVMAMVRHCLVFFTEFLTRRPRRNGEVSSASSLTTIQNLCVACLLTPPVAECLLALTSVKVELLETRRHVSSCAAVEPALSRLVWLALTLVGQLLGREAGQAALLRRMEFSGRPPAPHYFRALLSFLLWEPPPSALGRGPPLAAVALSVLRRVVQLSALPVLPCLGDAAPQLRAVFLRRLASWSEDDGLRAVQLDLLSEAVVSGRPGLLHLMASVGEEPAEGEAAQKSLRAPPGAEEDCVAAVHALLERREDCGPGLQLALFKFFDSVWQAEATAVTRRLANCPKGDHFWKRLEDVLEKLLEKDPEELPNLPMRIQMVGHVFSLTAMELYQKKWSNCDSKFQELIRHLLNKKVFIKWIKLLEWTITPEGSFSEEFIFERMSAAEMCFGRGRLLFLVLLRTAPPALETPVEAELEFLNTLVGFYETLNNAESDDCRPELTAETLSLLTVFIHRRISRQKAESVEKLLDRMVMQLGVTRAKTDVAYSSHMDLLSCVTQLVQTANRSFGEKNSVLWDRLFAIICEYVSLLTLKEDLRPAEQKILSHSLVLLTNLVNARPRVDWTVHVSLILNNVMFLLQSCLSTGTRPSLALHALLFLHTISQHSEEAQLLASYDLPCLLNFSSSLSLAPPPSAASTSRSQALDEELPLWSEVVVLVLRLVSSLLSQLGRAFFPKAAAFFGAQWWTMLAPPLHRCLRSLAPQDLIVGEAALQLVWGLALHRQLWHLHLPQPLLEAIGVSLHTVAHRCTALMQVPKWLQHQVEAGGGGGGGAGVESPAPVAAVKTATVTPSAEGKAATPHRVRHRQRSRSSSRTSSVGPDVEDTVQPRVRRVEYWLFRLLMVALSAFDRISPSISELVGQPLSELEDQELLVRPSFSSPGLQEEGAVLSMGVLIAVLHLTVKQLSKIDSRSSPTKASGSAPDDVILSRSMTTQCQEEALSLLMSQAVIMLNSSQIAPLERQNVYRELSAELSAFLKNTGRHLRRSGVKSPDPPEARAESMHRCVENFLKTVLK